MSALSIGANEQAQEARIGSCGTRLIFEDNPHLLAGPSEAGWDGEWQKDTSAAGAMQGTRAATRLN